MPYQFLLFLAVFTGLALIGYSLTPKKHRYLALLAASVVCVVGMSGYAAVFVAITVVTTYAAGRLMDAAAKGIDLTGLDKSARKAAKAKIKHRKKLVVAGYALVDLGILLVLKYFNFFSSAASHLVNLMGGDSAPLLVRLALPLGLSYYTLQALSYVIDVYRGKYPPEKNFCKLALFVTFFPQLHEGPFGRYDLLMPQMTQGKSISLDNIYDGLIRILWGLFQLLMVANRAAMISDAVFSGYESYGGWTVALGASAFTLQLYAEFSGYIHIAQGVSRFFGITLARNFDLPFAAQTVAEFWRRWHISLGAFFRDYVFYPISTSKWLRSLTKPLAFAVGSFLSVTVSLLGVWFLTGLWHGASWKYVCYGLYYFLLILAGNLIAPWAAKLLSKAGIGEQNPVLVCLRVVRTWILVLIGMAMFRAPDMGVFFHMAGSLFTAGAPFSLLQAIDIWDLSVLVLSAAVLAGVGIAKLCHADPEGWYCRRKPYQRYLVCFALFCIIMIFGAYGLGYIAPDPIYGGF